MFKNFRLIRYGVTVACVFAAAVVAAAPALLAAPLQQEAAFSIPAALIAHMGRPQRVDLPSDFVVKAKTAFGTIRYTLTDLKDIELLPNGQIRLQTRYGDNLLADLSLNRILREANRTRPAETPLVGEFFRVVLHTPAEIEDLLAKPLAATQHPWKLRTLAGETLFVVPAPDDSTLRFRTEAGEFDIPFPLLRNLAFEGPDTLANATLAAGIQINGFVTGGTLSGYVAPSNAIEIAWAELASATPMPPPDGSVLPSSHPANVVFPDGTEAAATLPAGLWPLKTSAAILYLPTSLIASAVPVPDGDLVTIRTIYGEALSGRLLVAPVLIAPDDDPDAPARRIPLASITSIALPQNAPDDLPAGFLSWRLRAGDLLVARWLQPDVEAQPVAAPRASSRIQAVAPTHPSAARPGLPRRDADGDWPLRTFDLVTPAGQPLALSAADVLDVYAAAPAAVPPVAAASAIASLSARASDEVLVPAGTFTLGRIGGSGLPDELPPVELSIPSFYLSATPVTVAQFAEYVDRTGDETDAAAQPLSPTWDRPGFQQSPDAPVVFVSWRDAARYCNWRSKLARLSPAYEIRRGSVLFLPEADGYRLPLEAEWEYAARAGLDAVFPWGDDPDESVAASIANFRPKTLPVDAWPTTAPVKAYPPNCLGLFDMCGNVRVWCQDIYDAHAYAHIARDPGAFLNPDPGALAADNKRSVRGGSWSNSVDWLRPTLRGWGFERHALQSVGFRLARNAPMLRDTAQTSKAFAFFKSAAPPLPPAPKPFRHSKASVSVSFLAQPPDLCGPASLYMIEKALGGTPDFESLVKAIYVPALKGSIPALLADAAQKDGFPAEVLENVSELKLHAFLQAREPLILLLAPSPDNPEENPRGHFIVLTAHDLATGDIEAHTGDTRNRAIPHADWYPRFLAAGSQVVHLSPKLLPSSQP